MSRRESEKARKRERWFRDASRAVLLTGMLSILGAAFSSTRFFAFSLVAQTPVNVMTFNIRYGTADDGAHVWPNRRAHVITTIRDRAPQVLGVQEALHFQLEELREALPRYQVLGVGRDD